jgi:hypothetical protein
MLGMQVEYNYERIAMSDESWFQYSVCSDSIFTEPRESIVPRIPGDISGQKTLVPIFLILTQLLVLEALSEVHNSMRTISFQ